MNSPLKVVGWETWDQAEVRGEGMTPLHELAVHDEIIEKGYSFSGEYHQSKFHAGVPVFDDGTAFMASMRYWGGVMATAWNQKTNSHAYDYMDFYMEGWGHPAEGEKP